MCVCVCNLVFMDLLLLVFVQHITGMTTVRRNLIRVDLQDDSEAIVAHVCANSLVLPRGLIMDKGSYISSLAVQWKLSLVQRLIIIIV